MARPHENKRMMVGLILTVLLWAISCLSYLDIVDLPTRPTILQYALHWVLVFLAGYSLVFFFWIFPVFVVVAIMKLRDQKRIELHELGDDNTVKFDPDGERKLHQYLTAINSTEARIGLLQRSEPWPGPEPERIKPRGPLLGLSKSALSTIRLCVVLGFVAGLVLGISQLLPERGAEASTVLKRTLFMRIVVSGLLGAVFAAPLGWIVALLFGRSRAVERLEESDDAGGSGTETA